MATELSRRAFLRAGSMVTAGAATHPALAESLFSNASHRPLTEFTYDDVTLAEGLAETQFDGTHGLLMSLDEDSLLKPFRMMAGRPAPGAELGGWYQFDPNYDYRVGDPGFAPGSTFGQWVSALCRAYAAKGSPQVREKILRLNQGFAAAISSNYFDLTRFPAYSYDKLVCGLIDAHQFAADPNAFSMLDQVTDLALPHLPPRAVTREKVWRPGKDISYTWDESYTMPENLFLASQRGAGERYRRLAQNYLEDETYFDPLANGQDAMKGRHAYSYVNALCSAMQAYFTLGSRKHLHAASNGFDLLAAQSFATGGWGPDELLRAPASDDLFTSLTGSHNSFETPCGSYAHFKLTRSLLRQTRDSRYGDSMERVLYNTVLGSKPLQPDGHAFYYADYNLKGSRVYSDHRWPCCSGTLPQVAADYRLCGFFRDGHDIFVNLYHPSTLKWTADGRECSLSVEGQYPLASEVRLRMTLSHSASFALCLRIPAWAEGASVSINGKHQSISSTAAFFRLHRKWHSGDQLVLTLPMRPRLEAINARHPETVALLRGPLVLFALDESPSTLTRKALLSAQQTGPAQWSVDSAAATTHFVPFSDIGDRSYSTYVLNVTS